MLENKPLDEVTGGIVDACVKLHTSLGPGLLESIYETVLARDLERRGFHVEKQKPISFEYDGLEFVDALRVDILVESRVVVEINRSKNCCRCIPSNCSPTCGF